MDTTENEVQEDVVQPGPRIDPRDPSFLQLCQEYGRVSSLDGRTAPRPSDMQRMREIEAELGLNRTQIFEVLARNGREEHPCG